MPVRLKDTGPARPVVLNRGSECSVFCECGALPLVSANRTDPRLGTALTEGSAPNQERYDDS